MIFVCTLVEGQQLMNLYPDAIPNSINAKDVESQHYNNDILIVEHVSRPTLTAYYPSETKSNKTAIIICPGGAYAFLAAGHEGEEIAKQLNKSGITAFVLKYRIPSNRIMRNKEIAPLQDVQQAIKIVRSRAKEFDIDEQKIGVMGFSAGGHLASSAGTHFPQPLIENKDSISLRPDFMILVYPVISFTDSIAHSGSRDNLLYLSATQQKKEYFSGELQVTNNTPPAFLVHASDDSLVSAINSTAFFKSLLLHNVKAELHIYGSGGHGFGIRKKGLSIDSWFDRLIDWLKENRFVEETINKNAIDQLQNDWASIKKYEIDNQKIIKSDLKNKVVFLGSSSIENWARLDSMFFVQNSYINRGISGQTTAQMLVRFRQDVINLKPALVVLLAGTNDIAQNTGFISHENILGNIISMAELAKANNIKIIFCSNLPVLDFPWRRGLQPAEKIKRLNAMIKKYADTNGIAYADFYKEMVDEKDGMQTTLTEDGAHANLAGYKIMEAIVKQTIVKFL
ncbi:MAG: GDSL-type esterase/lipase family protein [Bacteroidota bacterium]